MISTTTLIPDFFWTFLWWLFLDLKLVTHLPHIQHMYSTVFQYSCPPTSLDLCPACIETSTTDIGIRFKAHRNHVTGAGDAHWSGCGGAEFSQLRGWEVWAPIHLREKLRNQCDALPGAYYWPLIFENHCGHFLVFSKKINSELFT